MKIVTVVREWTLPVAIAIGTAVYLLFRYVPALDAAGDTLPPVMDTLLPVTLFFSLLVTFCKVDFHLMRPHRWHLGVLVAQLALVAANVAIITASGDNSERKLLWEAVLACVIAPSASAAPVVVDKLGGNLHTMTTFTLLSAVASSLLIPAVFPLIESTAHVDFIAAFGIIISRVAAVLLLPLALGWLVKHYAHRLHRRLLRYPNLSFYLWSVSLAITTGITVKNIVHSEARATLLLWIAAATLLTCAVQFALGRAVGLRLGEPLNAGQALFQKNTGLSIWVTYMYLHPVASIGAGCYVLWQNIINSIELRHHSQRHA